MCRISVLQKTLAKLNPNKPHIGKLVLEILQNRSLFSLERVKTAVDFMKEQEQNKQSGESVYHNRLCAAIASLIGESTSKIQALLTTGKELYLAALNNLTHVRKGGLGLQNFTQGQDTSHFLPVRIAILLDILTNLARGTFDYQLPERPNNQGYYTSKELCKQGVKELQIQLITYWDHKSLQGCFGEPTFYGAWASGILTRFHSSTPLRELSLALSHAGHCIYLSLSRQGEAYIVRIDNRWIYNSP